MRGFAVYPFPFGFLEIGYDEGAVVYLETTEEERLGGERTNLTDEAFGEISEYLAGKRKKFDFPYRLEGTPFQRKVWAALETIPYGETRTYKDIARAIGNEKATRAVGMANNRNPIPIVVPCHRVIGTNGKLVGYAYGVAMKEALLELEQKNKGVEL